MIARFQLGFANRTLTYRLPARGRTQLRERLERLGILRESGHEHFNGGVVIPVVDEHGEVTELYGRKITPGLSKGTPLHLYLPGPHLCMTRRWTTHTCTCRAGCIIRNGRPRRSTTS
jgi:DNA primase